MERKKSQVYLLRKKRRSGIKRRQFSYSYYIPERRSFRERRRITEREISCDITGGIEYRETLAG
jgi:hypothetical protein